MTIKTSYVVWDGMVGAGADPDSYGFKIETPDSVICAGDGGNGSDVTLGRYKLFIIGAVDDNLSHITVSHVAMTGCGAPVYSDQARLISSTADSISSIKVIIMSLKRYGFKIDLMIIFRVRSILKETNRSRII